MPEFLRGGVLSAEEMRDVLGGNFHRGIPEGGGVLSTEEMRDVFGGVISTEEFLRNVMSRPAGEFSPGGRLRRPPGGAGT